MGIFFLEVIDIIKNILIGGVFLVIIFGVFVVLIMFFYDYVMFCYLKVDIFV